MLSTDPILLPTCLLEVKDDLAIVRLPHPRTRMPALFVVRDGLGIWEIQSVVSPPTSGRTWFFQPSREDQPDQVLSRQAGRLLFVTAFDPFFLLLGLFFGHNASEEAYNPFDQNSKKSNKKDHVNTRFEEIDSILERLQDHWLFIDTQDRPTIGDIELFTKEAFRDQHLSRIFASLAQDSDTTLWRVEPERVISEIKRKTDQLAATGLEAGRIADTIWARLAAKEVLSINIDDSSNASFMLNEIYKKISYNMIKSYLPKCISDHLSSLGEFEFHELEEEIKKKDILSKINPLEIGRMSNKRPETASNHKSLKLPVNKKIKVNEPVISSKSNNRKIDSFFIKSDVSSSKK